MGKYALVLLLASFFLSIENIQMTQPIIHKTNGTVSDGPGLFYLVKEPKSKPAKNKGIILLHGVGSNENDLFGLAGHLPEDFYVISPRGQFSAGPERYAWYHVDFSNGRPVINDGQEESSRELIRNFISQVKERYNLEEVYLGGFSQGAIMSYSIGLTHPGEITGIISLSGRILQQIRDLIKKEDRLQHVKVFVAHGIADSMLPVQYAREAKEYLQELNVQLTYHEYDMGHRVSEEELDDLSEWLK